MRTCSSSLSIFFLVLSISSARAQVQSNIAVIKAKLASAKGQQRFDLLNDLAWEFRFSKPDTSIILSGQAFTLGDKLRLPGLARALNIKGIANNYAGNKITAYEYYVKAQGVAEAQGDSIEIAYTHNNLGRIFQEQGLIDKAFPNITQASSIFKKLNDSTGMAYSFQSLGYLYHSQRNFKKAEENHLKVLAIRIHLNNLRNIQSAYHVLGRLYTEQGKADTALQYLLKADSVGRIQMDEIQLVETWIYVAKSYLMKGKIQKADSLLKVSLRIIYKKNVVRILSNALLMSSEVAAGQGNYTEAKTMLATALLNSKKIGDLSTTQDIYFALWKLNEKDRDKAAALYNQNQYLLIRDTMKNMDVSRQENELNFVRTILVREAENQKLKNEKALIEQHQKSQAILFASIILFIVLVAILMWLYLRKLKLISAQLGRKNEMLLQLNQEKDALMSVVAHDLKSPLNKIQGLSNLLKLDGELSKNQAYYVQMIDRVVRDGTSFISDLLSVHAFEMESLPEISEFDASEIVREKTNGSYGIAFNKKIKLHLHLQPVTISSDKEYLARITDNLVSNAIKFSPEQSEVTVSLERNGNKLLLSVEDKGPGFTEQDKKLLFKKFKKLSARPTGGESSNGLGLAIVKTLVDSLGGTIDLDNAVGGGTKFSVRIPLMAA
jgi:signal transduction histidine kinase